MPEFFYFYDIGMLGGRSHFFGNDSGKRPIGGVWDGESEYGNQALPITLPFSASTEMFLLKPSDELNRIVGASLGRALSRYPVMLHSATSNINHMELVFSLNSEQLHNASPFLQLFQSLVAKELNRYHGREGHF